MASSSEEQSVSLGADIIDPPDLSCKICSEQFRDPILLPCGHTYFLGCIEKVVVETETPPLCVSEASVSPGTITPSVCCPDCATRHAVPRKGLRGFMTDFAVVHDIEVRTWRICMKHKSSLCGTCESPGKTEAFCIDCSAFLCSYCTDAHKRIKSFQEHQVTSSEISSLMFRPKQKAIFCEQHPNIAVNMYCATCEEMICTECLCKPVHHSLISARDVRYHTRHNVHHVTDDSLALYKTKLSQLFHQAKTFQLTLEQELQERAMQKEKLKEHPDELKRTINENVNSWIATLEKTRANALNQIDDRYKESLKLHEEEVESLSSRLNSLESSLRFTNKALISDSNNIISKYAVMSQAKSLLETPLGDLHSNTQVPTSCSFYLLKTTRRESNAFSLLISCEQNLSIGKISKVDLGEISMIEVLFKVRPTDSPTFRIAYKGKRKCYCPLLKSVRIDHCSWELVFTPHRIGRYHVEAQVHGQWICSPPFSTSSLSQLNVGDIVRVSSDGPADILSEFPDTGRIKAIQYTTSSSMRTLNYHVSIVWGHDKEKPVEKDMEFSYVINSYRSFPLELVL